MGFNQENRLLKLTGPFGDDEVFVTSFSGQESMSRLFGFQIQFFSTKLTMKAKDLVGKQVTLEVERFDSDGKRIGVRFFDGYVNRLRASSVGTEADQEYREYRIEVVPWTWFLTQTSRCHIFVDMKLSEILDKVLNRASGEYHVTSEFDLGGLGSLGDLVLEQCVQYRETDFNFLSRMFEQYGIFYYFKHEDKSHKLIVGSTANYPSCEEASVKYPGGVGNVSDNVINSWEHSFEFVPGKWAHTDYDFKKPLTDIESNSPKISGDTAPDVSSYEMYDYPGEYVDKSKGSDIARVRQEENEVPHNVVTGSSSCKTFTAGHKFTLESHPDLAIEGDEKGEYLITTISHSGTQPYQSTDVESRYSNHFSCTPSSIVFRPRRITPKPVISGIQTGVVTGPSGEEIYTDEYGRIKVFFHWDREGRKTMNETTSMWVRCAQSIAGRKWGFMAIPRIGQEVVIEFLEGDPDRPLVVGGVYNNDQMPPYELPDNKTRTYFKTNSTKGGEGFNELMFEDKADDEMLFMHAQKNMDVRVLNDSKEFIAGHRHQIIGHEKDGQKYGDQSEIVMQDKHLNIKKDQQEHIEGNLYLTVGHGDAEDPGNVHCNFETSYKRTVGADGAEFITEGNDLRQVGGNASMEVSGSHAVKVGGGSGLNVSGDYNSKANNISSDASMEVHSKAGMAYAIESGMNLHIKSGMNLVIESGVKLSLKVGGSFVDINPAGVFISGPMVMINSGGAAGSGSGCSPQAPEATTAPAEADKAELKDTEFAHNEPSGQKSTRE